MEAAAIKKPLRLSAPSAVRIRIEPQRSQRFAESCQKTEKSYRLKSELLSSGHDQHLSGKLHLT